VHMVLPRAGLHTDGHLIGGITDLTLIMEIKDTCCKKFRIYTCVK
jgi:hypothetical protein